MTNSMTVLINLRETFASVVATVHKVGQAIYLGKQKNLLSTLSNENVERDVFILKGNAGIHNSIRQITGSTSISSLKSKTSYGVI